MQAHVRFRGIAAGLLLAGTFATQAPAQDYPTRPLRLVTGAPGGANDFITRVIAQGLSAGLGQPTVVENKPSGVMEGEAVVNAKADGYTLLSTSANLWISGLMQKVPFDALRDFRPVTLATSAPYILVVHPQLPAKSVAELIALAKARPGELNYVSLAVGSSNHLAGELFKFLAGVNLTRVSYKGVPLAISDLVTGQVHVLFSAVQTVIPHVKAGKLRALAVTTAEPSALVPGLPSVSATVKGYDTAARLGVFVPAGTPAPIVERLNRVIVEHLKSTDARERLSNAAIEPVGTSPEELAALMKLDIARWEKVLRAAGLSV
jgi:tripartite-type tricarboxylate transporter receptor subunit TctC